MPAIGAKSALYRLLLIAGIGALALPLEADDVLSRINYVATALSDGNASDAMTPFDKSFANYSKLLNYFAGLTGGWQVFSDVDVLDRQDTDSGSTLTVDWTITLTNQSTFETERRRGQVRAVLAREKGKWKIVDFSPVDLFNPQSKQQPK